MTALVLATAALLQTAGPVLPPIAHGMNPDSASSPSAPAIARRPLIGPDKAQHFFMSYAIASFSYGAGRAVGLDRESSLYGAMAGTLAAGVAKEIVDSKTAGDPSFADLIADILGAAAAYMILRQVR
jgi:uncharacterized protein YfiM (DUF2279 family)